MIRLKKTIAFVLVLSSTTMWGQSFTLKEAVDYAITHHVQVKNGQIDIANADAKVNEIKAIGLPQVNGSVTYTNNLIIQRMFIPANTFNPSAPANEVVAAEFGVKNSGFANFGLSQLLFDGSYLLGLKASSVYKELSVKSLTQTKQQTAESVAKAYYGILVNDKRKNLFALNVGRLDTLLKETRALYAQGFVEKVDVQRLEVQANNLKTEFDNVTRLQEMAYLLLKFQMGYPMEEPIVLKENLDQIKLNSTLLAELNGPFEYANRIEYSILKTQESLAELDVKSQKAGYLPRLVLNANYGFNTGRKVVEEMITKPWFDNATVGFSIQVPIFDGFSKKYKTIQSENNLRKVRQSFDLVKSSIDLQRNQGMISLRNSLESLKEQKENLDLANEISRVSRVKYQQGVGSNLEVLNAETSLKESQVNYFTALYNALIAKVELEKANGTLYND
ncbi:TolC family protein [Aquirufa sp. ROCK2-A2]